MQLAKGQNCSIPTQSVRVVCRWGASASVDADLSAMLLRDGRVRDDADFVFYNQPVSANGAVSDLGKRHYGQSIEAAIGADLLALPPEINKVVIVLSIDGPRSCLADLGPIEAVVTGPHDNPLASFAITDITVETSAILFELYRRDGGWKVRAVGQGYDDGLAGLARDFGVNVDDEVEGPSTEDTAADVGASFASVDWTNPPVPTGYEL